MFVLATASLTEITQNKNSGQKGIKPHPSGRQPQRPCKFGTGRAGAHGEGRRGSRSRWLREGEWGRREARGWAKLGLRSGIEASTNAGGAQCGGGGREFEWLQEHI